MKGTTIIFLVAVFLLLVLAWLVQETDPAKQYGSRLSCLFWKGVGNMQNALAQARSFFRLYQTEGMASYQGNVFEGVEAQTKQHIEFGKEDIFNADYKKREKYNRKVLE